MLPVLLLHGYPFDHTMWGATGKALLRLLPDARVLAPDLPGFGKRPPPAGEPSLDLLADACAESLDRAGVARAVVAGMSMGGYVALALSERRPERLAGLALVNSKAEADADEARAARRRLIEVVRRDGVEAAVAGILPRLFSSGRAGDPACARFAEEGARKAGVEGICWALEAMARRPDRTATLSALAARSVPVAFVHGLEDALVPADAARAAAAAAGAAFVPIEGAGHASPLEAPEAVAAALAGLVRRAGET